MNAITANVDLAFAPQSRTYAPAPRRAGFVAAIRWLADLPRRRAVINELQSLSDHELADIGLSREEVRRVFDRRFRADRVAV